MNDPYRETGVHYTSLSENHQATAARHIKEADLRDHLIWEHGVSAQNAKTKAQLGRLHMLVHSVLAYPELSQLMDLPPEWGNG